MAALSGGTVCLNFLKGIQSLLVTKMIVLSANFEDYCEQFVWGGGGEARLPHTECPSPACCLKSVWGLTVCGPLAAPATFLLSDVLFPLICSSTLLFFSFSFYLSF